MEQLQGRWALVTGASSGIGAAFARRLAAAGMHVAVVARREDRLKELAAEIEAGHAVQTHVVAMDLAVPGAAAELHQRMADAGRQIDLLVNNAGFGVYGHHVDIPWELEHQMLELDIIALSHLTKCFLADMVARDCGWIIQVASIGAYQSSPTYAAYSAAKAFVLSLGEALNYELRRTRVYVSVLAPGVTKSEFLQVSGQEPTLYQRMTLMSAERVAEIGLRAVLRGRPSVIPGVLNKVAAFSLRFIPRRMQAAVANATMNVG